MRALPTIYLVSNLPLGIVNENLTVASLNENHKTGHYDNKSTNDKSSNGMHRACPHQFE